MSEPRAVSRAIHAAAARLMMAPADLDTALLHAEDPALRRRLGELSHTLTVTYGALLGLSLCIALKDQGGDA